MKKILFLLLASILFIACNNEDEENIIPRPEPEAGLRLSLNEATLNNSKNFEVIDILEPVGECFASSSNQNVATAEIDGEKLIILGFKTGETDIIVSDSKANTAKVKISVENEIIRVQTITEVVFVKKGETRVFKHPYPADMGYTLLPDQYSEIIATTIGTDQLIVDGKEGGRTVLSVSKNYWTEYNYDIRVVEEYPLIVPIGKYSLSQNSKGGGFGIGMGNGGYKVESSDPTVATGYFSEYVWDITNANYNPIAFNVDSFKPGTAILTVSDESGQSKQIEVEVREK